MTLKENQRLVCAGQMPLRAPGGEQLAAVPVYKIVSAKSTNADAQVELSPDEQLVFVGSEESLSMAKERYRALKAGEIPLKSKATPLYIKSAACCTISETGLTDGEKRVLNPLIGDLLKKFEADMREQEALKQ